MNLLLEKVDINTAAKLAALREALLFKEAEEKRRKEEEGFLKECSLHINEVLNERGALLNRLIFDE